MSAHAVSMSGKYQFSKIVPAPLSSADKRVLLKVDLLCDNANVPTSRAKYATCVIFVYFNQEAPHFAREHAPPGINGSSHRQRASFALDVHWPALSQY